MIKKTILNQLAAYKDFLVSQINKSGYCGEFISDLDATPLNNTRLLCQTRGIFFLIDYAEITGDKQYIEIATELYKKTQETYYNAKLEIWTQYPSQVKEQNTLKDKMLYEYAFVITAYAKLYQANRDRDLLKLIARVKEIIFQNYYNHNIQFKQLEQDAVGINQNALMHLFEALIETTNITDEYKEDLQIFGQNLLGNIHDNKTNLIREMSLLEIYEPGHSFEWASLILEAKQKSLFDTLIDEVDIVAAAEKYGLTSQGFVVAELSSKNSNDKNIRIWPTLEQIRYYAMTKDSIKMNKSMETLIKYFFSDKDLPFEYLNENLIPQQQKVKSTTGYHIINCYKYVLPLLK